MTGRETSPVLRGMEKGARLSECSAYRYSLTRRWGSDGTTVLWVMLNPSTADADVDDPTIRRCIGFSKAWGFDGLEVINLFALRATDPKELARHPSPEGPDNWREHAEWKGYCGRTVVAWGAHPMAAVGARSVEKMYAARGAVCLGRTKSGHPRHPLYVRADQPLEPWRGVYASPYVAPTEAETVRASDDSRSA